MLSLSDVECTIGDRTLFSHVTFNINPHDRFGLVGANGTGKTTLLRIINNEISPTRGLTIRPNTINIGYLPQEEIVLHGSTLMNEVLKDYNYNLKKLSTLQCMMTENPYSKELMKQYQVAEDYFHKMGGYNYESEAYKVINGLGFTEDDYNKSVEDFSSGWQMRIVLARFLLNRPDLLLLDEPTNHLDIESLEWLENYLQDCKGAMIVVSHDRYFLDKILQTSKGTIGIFEINFGTFKKYHTNYTGYLHESLMRKQKLIEMAKNQQRKIEEIKEFIVRNKANKSKAGIVKSREKYLERLEIIQIESDRKKIRVGFPVEEIYSPQVVELKKVSKFYNSKKIFEGVNVSIKNGNKIALIGKNGAGKSSLCRIIAGIDEPTSGMRWASEKLRVAAFSHQILLGLNPSNTIIEDASHNAPDEVLQNIRNFLGLFLFTGDDVFKRIEVLSGGEKTRLIILKAMLNPSNLLILDEPTYHLDKDSVEAIKQAIGAYTGTVILVTHDRELIADFANRIIELKDGKLFDYPGNYSYYLWKREHRPDGSVLKSIKSHPEESSVEKMKNKILQKEARRNRLRETFSRPSYLSNPRKAKKLFEEYQRLSAEIDELEKKLTSRNSQD